MQLTVTERILLINLLPAEGSVIDLRVMRKLRESLSFSEEEQKALEFRHPGEMGHMQNGQPQEAVPSGMISWKVSAEPNKEFQFGDRSMTLIKKYLQAIDQAGKATEAHLPLFDKFLPPDKLED